MPSLCETCKNMKEVRTARSRFLFCELAGTNPVYPKYPPQPVQRCGGYEARQEDKMADDPCGRQP